VKKEGPTVDHIMAR
jgi:hypothetical protein